MRKAIISVTLAAVLTAVALFSGCELASPEKKVAEGGNVITKEIVFSGFTYVDIQGAFDVEITQSDSFSILVNADESLYDYVEVSKVGTTLRIYLTPRHILTDFTVLAKTLEVKITMPNLYGLTIAGASTGTVTGFMSPRDFTLNVSGASSLGMYSIEVGDIESEVSGASHVSGNLTTGDAAFEVSGASSVELSGSADNIILNVSGASRVDLADFPLRFADAELSGASEVTLNVTGRLDSVLSGASRLYFLSNPTMGNIEVSGASTIKHK